MRTINVNDVISYGDKIIGRVTNVSNDTELYGAPYATIFCIHHENKKLIGSEIRRPKAKTERKGDTKKDTKKNMRNYSLIYFRL